MGEVDDILGCHLWMWKVGLVLKSYGVLLALRTVVVGWYNTQEA